MRGNIVPGRLTRSPSRWSMAARKTCKPGAGSGASDFSTCRR